MTRQKTGGRQLGSTNKVTRPLKELITDVLTNELNEILIQGHTMSFDEREHRIRVVSMLGRLIIKPDSDITHSEHPVILIPTNV